MAEQVIPLAPQAEQPQPNMFANWGANPVGNWNKVMDKSKTPAAQFVGDKMKEMNIPDPQNPQPENVVPYAPGTTAAQPVSVPKTKQTSIKTTDSRPVNAGSETGGVGYVNPNSETAGIDALLYTSPEQEERLRKSSVQRQRIYAIGDALRHIGNIYNTVNGAPSQKFNSPVEEERRRYLQEKAIRDQNNYKYMTYQQAKAAQEAKQKQWEHDYALKVADAARKAGYTEAQIKAMQDRIANQRWYQEGQLQLGQQKHADTVARWERQDKETAKHHRVTEGISATNSRNAENYRQWKMQNGGSGGSKGQNTVYSRRGYLTKAGATSADLKNIYDNMYDWGKKRGYIKESDILAGEAPALFGGKKITDASKREAVNRMLMEHDDAAVQMHHKHGFDWHEQTPYNGGQTAPQQQAQTTQQSDALNPYWRLQQPQEQYPSPLFEDDDEEEDMFGDFDASNINF